MGRRGEGWVVLQMVLFAVILLAPPAVRRSLPPSLRPLGALLLLAGGVFGTWGMLSLGKSLSAFPKPVEGGELVTTGPYRIVRHPIYSGLILGTLGLALLRTSLLGAALAVALFAFFDLKSRREEKWLAQAYAGYEGYRARVRKLIPFVY